MQNNQNKRKSTVTNLKTATNVKAKLMRHSVAKLPKHLDSTYEQKSPRHTKFKTLPIRSLRQITYSFTPAEFQIQQAVTDLNTRGCKSGFSETDILHSRSDKTIHQKMHKKEESCKSYKKGKITKTKNYTKQDQIFKLENRGAFTTRKSSVNKNIFQDILVKTERVLKKYQIKEKQWQKQKQTLIEQIQCLKRKSNIKTMTSSASSYIVKKYLY